MNRKEVEFRAANAIERVTAGSRTEDDWIELKSDLSSDYSAAARRIAGLCNASRGEQVIWIVGLEEEPHSRHKVTVDPGSWWPQVERVFDGVAPDLLVTHVDDLLVLGFDPSSPPYVVKVPPVDKETGRPLFEVPWRSGTILRSARKADLQKVLVPSLRSPEIEPVSGELRIHRANSPTQWVAQCALRLFVVPRSSELVTLPSHRIRFELGGEEGGSIVQPALNYRFEHEPSSLAEALHSSQLVCRGPGFTRLIIGGDASRGPSDLPRRIVVTGSFRPAPDGPSTSLRAEFEQISVTNPEAGIWGFDQSKDLPADIGVY